MNGYGPETTSPVTTPTSVASSSRPVVPSSAVESQAPPATSAPAPASTFQAPEPTVSSIPASSPAPAPAPSSQAPAPPTPPTLPAQAPASSSQTPAPQAVKPSPPPAPSAPSAPPAAQPSSDPQKESGVSPNGFPLGVTYDPFKAGGCKTEDEINSELDKLKDFGIFRIYGMGCNIIPLAIQRAKAHDQNIMAGIYRSADPNSNENIDAVVSVLSNSVQNYAGGDWSIISLVSVENEKVNSQQMTASDAVSIIQQARTALKKVGYNGPVGAVETAPATTGNPSICRESDMALVNIHAWFDTNTKAEDAGTFVRGQVDLVKKACPGKRVIVTESGWPHQGDSHDQAVASPDAQKAALKSIRSKFQNDLFLFNGFDSLWKTDDAYTHNAEKYWGIM